MRASATIGCLLVLMVAGISPTVIADTAEDIYRDSGLRDSLEQLGPAIAAQVELDVEGLYAGLTDAQRTRLLQAINVAFSEPEMRPAITRAFREELNGAERDRVLDWLSSSTGTFLTELENHASSAAGQVDLLRFAQSGNLDRIAVERTKLLEDLDLAAQITAFNVELVLGIQLGMVAGVLGSMPSEAGQFEQQLATAVESLDAYRPLIASQVAGQVALSSAFTYQDATDAEIEEYIQFLLSPAGERFTEVAKVALGNSIIEASMRLGALMFDSANDDSGPT